MSKKRNTKVRPLAGEIKKMQSAGKTQREIAEHFGLRNKYAVKELLKRERRKQSKLAAGIPPKTKRWPRKDAHPGDVIAEQAYEISRLKMENALLRDFLCLAGRK